MHCWRSRWWLRDRFLWRLECGVESPRLWSTRDQGSNIAWSEKKAKKPLRWLIYVFNSVVNTKLPAILSHRRSTTVSLETYPFIHYVNKKLKLRLASISGVNLHNLSWTKSLWISKIKTIFLNYICFIFIHLADKAFQITVKAPDVVHFEFLDLS